MLPNWLPAKNTWDLPAPPDWFLQKLYNFDEQLVLFPSQAAPRVGEKPHYVLARRRQLTAGMSDLAILENKHPDTNLMIAHGLVPIGPLRLKKGVNTFTEAGLVSLLEDLEGRDQWKLTGGLKDPDAGWKALEAAERKQLQKQRRSLKDMFAHMARDAYRSLKARTGQRNKRASDYHGVARQPTTAQGVILTDAR
jgi:hypothetical protein